MSTVDGIRWMLLLVSIFGTTVGSVAGSEYFFFNQLSIVD